MAPLTSLLTVALCSSTAAFSATSNVATTSRPSTKLYENFGFDFAEDQVENTPQIILGEANYKTWLNGVDPDNFMNRQVSYIKYWCIVVYGGLFFVLQILVPCGVLLGRSYLMCIDYEDV